jgi:hypothetical protein
MRMEVTKDKYDLFTRVLFWFMRRRSGTVSAPLRIYALRPEIMRTFLGLGRAVRKPGALPERLKRLAMFRTARLVECAY